MFVLIFHIPLCEAWQTFPNTQYAQHTEKEVSMFPLICLQWIGASSCVLKIWRKLDIDGRCSELSIDFYKSTSAIIEMPAIKKKPSLPPRWKYSCKEKRQKKGSVRGAGCTCTITVLKPKKFFFNYLGRLTARCVINSVCYQTLWNPGLIAIMQSINTVTWCIITPANIA